MPQPLQLSTGALLFSLAATSVAAQNPTPPCRSAVEAHALDFWLGDWTVRVRGQLAGTNQIEAVLGGCAITERWNAGTPDEGRSLFYYLPVEKEWRQVWVTAGAMRPGGVKEKRQVPMNGAGIRFQGTIAMGGGQSYLDRTTLTPGAEGTVRQLIEYSTDGGATWTPAFDGIYAHEPPAPGSAGAVSHPPESLDWRPAAPGVETAIAEGRPAVAGARFTMLLRFADGGWIPPHWHNVEKVLTVVSGELRLGEGDRLDRGATRGLGPGSVIVIPAGSHHFEGGRGATVVALTAVGPFQTTMVTP